MDEPTETPSPTETPTPEPPAPTVTETVTLPAEPVLTCTSADPCVVAPSDPIAVPAWTGLGLVLLLLAAILASQLRRP